jgi:hypothetical protein
MHRHRLFRARLALPFAVAAALVAALAVSVTAGFGSTARVTAAPTNQSPPTISGTPQVGSTLTADTGNWTGNQSFTYQWRRCDQNGGSCADISGATSKTYTLANVDKDNTLRVVVTAKNTDGSTSRTSVPTAVVTAAAATASTTTTTAQTSATEGCPKTTQSTSAVAVTDVAAPARLQISGFTATPSVITAGTRTFQMKVTVTDTCGQPVSGANVYATAVPFEQVSIPPERPTGSDGSITLTFNRLGGFPLSSHQQLMAFFIRASKPGDNILAGISTRRLVSVRVNLHG